MANPGEMLTLSEFYVALPPSCVKSALHLGAVELDIPYLTMPVSFTQGDRHFEYLISLIEEIGGKTMGVGYIYVAPGLTSQLMLTEEQLDRTTAVLGESINNREYSLPNIRIMMHGPLQSQVEGDQKFHAECVTSNPASLERISQLEDDGWYAIAALELIPKNTRDM